MAGPTIIVPPAMPQRSLLSRQPHLHAHAHSNPNVASKSRQGTGTMALKGRNTNATTPAGGRKERVNTTSSRRVCSSNSCTNVLDPGWPWKRCRQCLTGSKGREGRKATNPYMPVDVACASCFVVSEVVHASEIKAGQPYLCGPCRERNTSIQAALLQAPALNPQQTPAPPRNIAMHDTSRTSKRDASSLGHGPPPVPQAFHPIPSVYVPTPPPPPPPLPSPQGPFMPMPVGPDANTGTRTRTNVFDEVRRFVHPDHRYILGRPEVLVPPPPLQISSAPTPTPAAQPGVASTSPTTPQGPAVKRVRLLMPHYSRTGAILAVLPEDVGIERSSLPRADVSNPPQILDTPATETEIVPGSGFVSLAQIELRPQETPRKVSVMHTEDGSIKLKIPPKQTPSPTALTSTPALSAKLCNAPSASASQAPTPSSSSAPAPPPLVAKKRKRALRPANRVCELPGCENVILPRFKGSRCAQCGFARWSKVFRERFDGIRAELIQAGISGPATTIKDPEKLETLSVKERPAAVERVSSTEGVHGLPSDATTTSPERAPSTAKGGKGASQRAFTVSPSGIPPPAVFKKPSIKSVKLIVSPRHTELIDNAISLAPTASSSRTETLHSGAVYVPRPKIKSIKLRVTVPPDSHTGATDIPATDTDDMRLLSTSPLTDLDSVEDEEGYRMDVDQDPEASDGDTTESEASIPLARRYAVGNTGAESIPQPFVPATAEAADGGYPMAIDYDPDDHTGDTTESEASVPLADWAPSHIPSTTPRSASLPPIRRVRLILGPEPSRIPSPSFSTSRESSPELALSSVRPFSVRRRWEALGWDTDESDLTPLEGSTDEGESEIDLSESSDDEGDGEGGDGAGTRLSIIIPRRPPEKHRWLCATARCANVLAHGSFFKNCDACRKRAHLLRKQAKRDRLEDPALGKYDDVEFHTLPDADLTGYRQCSNKRCSRLVPPESQYHFRTCGPCRARARRTWWRTKGLEPPDYDPSSRKSAKASIMERAIANAVRTAAKEEGAGTGKRKRRAVDEAREKGDSATGEKLMEMPPYQHFAALLESMRARFSQFKAVQARYIQLKALTGTGSKPMVFNFDGEYSVVADPAGGSVDSVVNTVIRNVQAALELRFQPAGVQSGPEESVIASLSGGYVAKILPLSKIVPATTDSFKLSDASSATQAVAESAASAPLEVAMAGELHICVAWDRRHKFFPGQRVMLRFRLVG